MTAGAALGLCLLLTAGCYQVQQQANVNAEGMEAMSDTVNTLTDAEKAEGWMLLFDGASLDAWRGFRRDTLPRGWHARDGALYFDGDGNGDIVTRETFENFDLKLEWKISPGGNSGIMFRADEDHDTPWQTGPEMQVLDDAAHPDAANGPVRMAGANYDVHPPAQNVVRPAGQWNSVRILADGPHVEHWLNGVKIVEYELWSDDWKQRVAKSKWKDYPDYGMVKSGHIVLQDHGDPVWYRAIKIRRLPASPTGQRP